GQVVGRLAEGPIDTESAVIVRGVVVSTSWGERTVSGMDAETGERLWAKPFGQQLASPSVAHRKVFIASGNVVRALRPRNGSAAWKTRLDATRLSDVAVADGHVFIVTAREGAGDRLVALDADTGAVVWTRKVAYGSTAYNGESVVTADGIVVTSRGYKLTVLDTSDGSTVWTSEVTCCLHRPAVAHRVIYTTTWTADDEGILHAVDATTGEVLWSTSGTGYSDGVSVANGVVYQASFGLNAFDAATGESLFDLDIGFTWEAPLVVDGTVYLAVENGPHDPPEGGEGLYALRLPEEPS
ncbi:MAG: PQQ-binding-like beta-propeller repeat protein, partial [Actinomycetota bacterium]|nr:PQQ-binding-like beta-propeller repeat protein [Actinomycetota bacterium]